MEHFSLSATIVTLSTVWQQKWWNLWGWSNLFILGDYDYYLEKKAELEELARLEAEENQGPEETQVASAGASDYQAQKASQKEIRKLSRRIEQIENELETIEERLGKISIAMLETNDVVELSDLQKELDDLSVNQEALMEEWSDLSEQLES